MVPKAQAPGGDLICRLYRGNSLQPVLSVHQIRSAVPKYPQAEISNKDDACSSLVSSLWQQGRTLAPFVWASFRLRQKSEEEAPDGERNWLFLPRSKLNEMCGPLIPARIRETK